MGVIERENRGFDMDRLAEHGVSVSDAVEYLCSKYPWSDKDHCKREYLNRMCRIRR
jgi:hypothetical protein